MEKEGKPKSKFKKLLHFWKSKDSELKKRNGGKLVSTSPIKKAKYSSNMLKEVVEEVDEIPTIPSFQPTKKLSAIRTQRISSVSQVSELEQLEQIAQEYAQEEGREAQEYKSKSGRDLKRSISRVLQTSTESNEKNEKDIYQPFVSNVDQPSVDNFVVKDTGTIRRNTLKKRKSVVPVPFLVKELLTTEMAYVDSLNTVVKVFIKPLRSMDLLSSEELNSIFSNIETLLNLNNHLLRRLEERIGYWNPEQCLGDIFLEFVPFLKMYSDYMSGYRLAIETLQELKESRPKFRNFLQNAFENPLCKSQTLAGFLIMPIQRIPRYKLLMEQIVDKTDPSHPDYIDLKQALEEVSEVAVVLNDKIRDHENRLRILEIQKLFHNKNNDPSHEVFNLVQPHRKLIKQGKLWYLDTALVAKNALHEIPFIPKQRAAGFLFNDILLLACENEHGLKPISIFPIKSLFVKLIPENSLQMFLVSPERCTEWIELDSAADATSWQEEIDEEISFLCEDTQAWREKIVLWKAENEVWQAQHAPANQWINLPHDAASPNRVERESDEVTIGDFRKEAQKQHAFSDTSRTEKNPVGESPHKKGVFQSMKHSMSKLSPKRILQSKRKQSPSPMNKSRRTTLFNEATRVPSGDRTTAVSPLSSGKKKVVNKKPACSTLESIAEFTSIRSSSNNPYAIGRRMSRMIPLEQVFKEGDSIQAKIASPPEDIEEQEHEENVITEEPSIANKAEDVYGDVQDSRHSSRALSPLPSDHNLPTRPNHAKLTRKEGRRVLLQLKTESSREIVSISPKESDLSKVKKKKSNSSRRRKSIRNKFGYTCFMDEMEESNQKESGDLQDKENQENETFQLMNIYIAPLDQMFGLDGSWTSMLIV